MNKEFFFSIVIPVKSKNDYLIESINNCLKLDYPNFEILVLPDEYFEYKDNKVKVISTGCIGPAEKRDLSIKYAKGEVLAFLDDDAYPKNDWLKNVATYFEDESISAVCGPAITPDDDSLIQKLSGEIYSSILASGGTVFRYKKTRKIIEVDDFPSVNFLIRKEDFKTIGGFDSTYWPGEDTKLCLDIINSGKKIIYDPNILVYHHRRKSFKKHLIQVFNYAYHRGYFVKKFPKNSAKLAYFVPSLFLLTYFSYFYFGIIMLYLILLIVNSIIKYIENKNIKISLLLIPGIFLTHIFYGFGFLNGLLTWKVER